ncbi:MAG: sedoheptulokinase [Planctomycetaceae bacterium]
MRCIGIDVGSSSIKGAVINAATGLIEDMFRVSFPDPVGGLPAGWFEVNPVALVAGVKEVLSELLGRCPEATRVRFCSQMGGIMLMSSRTGEALTNYLSWRDQRTLGVAGGGSGSELPGGGSFLERTREMFSDAIFSELGRELKPGSATVLLSWLVQHGGLPNDATPVTCGDFITATLCGVRPRMHRTQGLGLINLRTGEWHREALGLLRLDSLNWPEFVGEWEPVGSFTWGGRVLECYASIGDQQAALRGIDLQLGELSVNLSTGAQVSRITRGFEPADCQTRCWFGGQYLNTITHIPAGRSLTVLESLLTELARSAGVSIANSWQLIGEACEAAGDSGGLRCDLSFFAGALGSEGSLSGITTENLTVGRLFQAAFDFMAEAAGVCASRLSPEAAWQRVAVSGGLVQSFPALQRKLKTRLPWPMREAASSEETLTGLMRLEAEHSA